MSNGREYHPAGIDEPRDNVQRFVQLFTQHERHLRAHLYQLLPTRDDVDEVMQNTSLVLWKKFDELERETDFLKWAYVVARYEVLAYRRSKARDRLMLDEDLIVTLSEESSASRAAEELQWTALQCCLSELPESDRRLINMAYARGLKIAALADTMNRSLSSLYKDLSRVRQRLVRCVGRRIQVAEGE
jgi:RNA polymerase sigma-70 factor (ECF subfamily)